MEKFIARHAALVSSVLSGFDRLVLRGLLRALRHRGIRTFLDRAGVRLIDFGAFAQETTERVKRASLAEAERTLLARRLDALVSPSSQAEQLTHFGQRAAATRREVAA